jgi:AraC-like DNA-binding protein
MVRQHLGRFLDEMFAEFTGIHFHILWAPPPPHEWDTQNLPTACSVCCRLSGSPLLPDCRICGPKQIARALAADGEGHRFTCRLGIRNYWMPLRVQGETLGIAYLQALGHPTAGPSALKGSSRPSPRGPHPAGARVLSRLKFARAARFLRFIVQHVQISTLADLRLADLTSARCAVIALEKEQVRPCEMLERHRPPTPQTPRHPGPESQSEQIVHRLLECIERDYAKPVTLQRYARELEMNAAYVSALFSRTVGIPFKTYLTELRLEKAKALLGDPAKTASDVAYEVGYASENRFRSAFKKATGLSPKLWRETMQTNPPNAA